MRGYQKRVIYLKNTGSRNFEEAYFIVRQDACDVASSALMIDEANKIIEENFGARRGRLYKIRWHILAFIAGAAASALFLLLSDIIFGIF